MTHIYAVYFLCHFHRLSDESGEMEFRLEKKGDVISKGDLDSKVSRVKKRLFSLHI